MAEQEEAEAENQAPTSKFTTENILDERGVPLSNVLKEVTRKLGRLNEVSSKLDLLLQSNHSEKLADKAASSYASDLDDSAKSYIDARLMEDKKQNIERAQKAALDSVFKTFPELDRNSDDYDASFYELAVEYEKTIDQLDPDRSMKAAKLAALDTGKIEKLQKAKLLQDDSRRNRILSEGSATNKDSKKNAAPKQEMNKAMISRFLKVDPAKIAKYAGEEN